MEVSPQNKSQPSQSQSAEEGVSYKRTPASVSEMQQKKFSFKEQKALKRKRREEKLLAQMEKHKKARKELEQKQKEEQQAAERKRRVGRPYTVSLALPGSILDNAQSLELRAYLAGQIARAASVFNIDEIVIFDENYQAKQSTTEFRGLKKAGQGNTQLFHILQYLECPQYLRKSFFTYHQDLVYAGLLNPLDVPHHLRDSDQSDYREGIILNKPPNTKKNGGSYANIGLRKECILNMVVPAGNRVTVKLKEYETEKKNLRGEVVSPKEPREAAGIYWGYTVRLASCLSEVFTDSPHDKGYDLTIGTSERGNDVAAAVLPKFKHAIVVFGGLKGLEASVEADDDIKTNNPGDLFRYYVNVCPNQGSRTIRTEEAILIAMAVLSPKLTSANSVLATT